MIWKRVDRTKTLSLVLFICCPRKLRVMTVLKEKKGCTTTVC